MGATDPCCKFNHNIAGWGEAVTRTRNGGYLGVGVDVSMTRQEMRPRLGWHEGGRAGKRGINSLPLVG